MQRYLETRTTTTQTNVAADIARHLLTRQHLGKAVVLCDKPVTTMSVTKKYWLRLARTLQKERSSTLNVERILQLTHDITRMHHMEFAAKPPSEYPHADIFFASPDQVGDLPPTCYSLYVLEPPTEQVLIHITSNLPDRALVVDYTHSPVLQTAALQPKQFLERQLPDAWQQVENFLHSRGIDLTAIVQRPIENHLLDQAIDELLNVSGQFLRIADDFLELLRLAQPTNTLITEQRLYDALSSLARRIRALTPGMLSQQFSSSLSDDNHAMHDIATEDLALALAITS